MVTVPKISNRFILQALLLLALLALMAAPAWGADNIANPDYVLERMKDIVAGFTPTLLKFARSLFMGLATLSLGVGLAEMILKGESTLGGVAAHLLKWIIYAGFFMYVMSPNFFIPHVITDSFDAAGTAINGEPIMPGDILIQGINIYGNLLDAADKLGWGEYIVAGASGIVIIVIFGILAATLTATLIEMYLVICGGSILLGFAGIHYTKDIAFAYLRYAVSVGAKILIISLIAVVAKEMTKEWADNLGALGKGEFFSVVGYLIGGSITLMMSAQMVPSIAQSVINGASVSSSGAFSSAGAAMMAPAMAAGSASRQLGKGLTNVGRAMDHYGEMNPDSTFLSRLRAGAAYTGKSAFYGADSWQAAEMLGRKAGNYVDPPA